MSAEPKTFLACVPDYNDAAIQACLPSLNKWLQTVPSVLAVVRGASANFAGLSEGVNASNPATVFLFGHGDEATVYGQDQDEELGVSGVSLMAKRFVVALSCSTAKALGPAAIKAGALGYLGFKGIAWVGEDTPGIACHDPTFYSASAIRKGKTLKQAHEAAIERWGVLIEKSRTSQVKGASDNIRYLVANQAIWVYLGDPDGHLDVGVMLDEKTLIVGIAMAMLLGTLIFVILMGKKELG